MDNGYKYCKAPRARDGALDTPSGSSSPSATTAAASRPRRPRRCSSAASAPTNPCRGRASASPSSARPSSSIAARSTSAVPSSAAPSCASSSRAPACCEPVARRDRRRAAGDALSARVSGALPITAAREELLAAIAQHRVIVVCGDTGSGKTTQLPKLCLEAGRGIVGMIGHTQPRRIAAQAVASRLAAELDVRVGEAVGLEMRFTDQTSPTALVKVMTDGILLNEIRSDRALARLRHADHRRGARAQPQHRLRARLFAAHRARAAGPQSHHHVRDDRPRALRRAFRRRADHSHSGPQLSRDAFATARAPTTRTSRRPSSTRRASSPPSRSTASAIRDMLVFLPGERWIRDAEHALEAVRPEGLRAAAALRAPHDGAATARSSSPARRRASCSRRTSPRRR